MLVDIPKDVQIERIEVTEWPEPVGRAPAPVAPAGLIAEAAAMINAAQRPILYLGGGVVHSGASAKAVWPSRKAPIYRR